MAAMEDGGGITTATTTTLITTTIKTATTTTTNNNVNNASGWERQRHRPDNREYRSNNYSDHTTNSYGPPPSTSNSKRSNERSSSTSNVRPDSVRSESRSHRDRNNERSNTVRPDTVKSEPYSHRDRNGGSSGGKKKKKRKAYNSSSVSNNESAASNKVVKLEENNTTDSNAGASTSTALIENKQSTTGVIVKTEEEPNNAPVRPEEPNSSTTTILTTTLTTTANQNEPYDSEAARQRWKTNLLACYRFPPDKQYLPIEAFTPDTHAVVRKKRGAVVHAVEQVMVCMRRDAELAMQKDDDSDDDSSNTDNSMYSMCRVRSRPVDFYPYTRDKIQLFFAALLTCTPLTIGFDVNGLRPRDDESCHCRRYNYCTRGKLTPIGLMSHVRKEGGSCVLHYGIMRYMEAFYCKNTGTYRGGIGHKAMYQMNDTNWRAADAAEKRLLNEEIWVGRRKLAEEKALRLELEKDRDEQTRTLELLKRTNEDQFERLQKLDEERKKLNVVKKQVVPELDSASVGRYREALSAFFNTAKKALRSLESNKDEDKLKIQTESPVNLQAFFDEWYDEPLDSNSSKLKKNARLLFHGLGSIKYGKNYYGRRIVDEWNVCFQNAAKGKEARKDAAVDDGGPTREFLSQCWKQMGGLRVWREAGEEEDEGLQNKSVFLFETQDNGVVPIPDTILRDKLKVLFPDDTEYKESLDRAKAYYRAIGRVILHSLANNHTISASAMPPFYQNWLLRGCSPKDDDYHKDDVLKHLSDGGASKKALHYYLGKEFEFEDGSKEILTTETVFTKMIPDQFIHPRKQAFLAINKGLTLDGDYSLVEFLRSFPLEAIQKVAFSSPHLAADDVIAVLTPKYCHDWEGCKKEKMELQGKQEDFFQNVLCKIINWKRKGTSNRNKHLKFLSRFVQFCTGFDYLPDRDGNPDFKIIVEFNFAESPKGAHPVAHTCVNTLKLPGQLYATKKEFKTKLDEAVNVYGARFDMN